MSRSNWSSDPGGRGEGNASWERAWLRRRGSGQGPLPAACGPAGPSPAGTSDVSGISSSQALASLPLCPGNGVEGREMQPPGSAGPL